MVALLDWDFVALGRGRACARAVGYGLFEGRPATTRGRFMNPLVFAHLRAAARLPVRDRVDRPIFVVGVGRSGTTLLGRMLGVHPDVGFLNEPKALWQAVNPDDDIIGSYRPTCGRLRLGAEDATAAMRVTARRLVSWYLLLTRSRRLVDKYPELIFRTPFVRALFPDARFVMVTRPPLDVVASMARWSASHRVGGADWWGVGQRKWRALWDEAVAADPDMAWVTEIVDRGTATAAERAAVEWLATATAALRLRHAPGMPFTVLAYEDLVTDPAGSVERLLAACGLPTSPRVLEFARRQVRAGRRFPVPRGLARSLVARMAVLAEELRAA
jgi:hypothetical protein